MNKSDKTVTKTEVSGMVKRKHHRALDKMFPFVASFIDQVAGRKLSSFMKKVI